jgi:hypothetical protein
MNSLSSLYDQAIENTLQARHREAQGPSVACATKLPQTFLSFVRVPTSTAGPEGMNTVDEKLSNWLPLPNCSILTVSHKQAARSCTNQ